MIWTGDPNLTSMTVLGKLTPKQAHSNKHFCKKLLYIYLFISIENIAIIGFRFAKNSTKFNLKKVATASWNANTSRKWNSHRTFHYSFPLNDLLYWALYNLYCILYCIGLYLFPSIFYFHVPVNKSSYWSDIYSTSNFQAKRAHA